MLPAIMVSDSAGPMAPPSMRKLFMITPEKLQLAALPQR